MEYSKNLGLNLPSDTDPLEISKLSENFEKLDEAIAGGGEGDAGEIVRGLKIGDIVYSTRNLELETGGKMIACDQRIIELAAYPDLPVDKLFWPYAELVFEHNNMSVYDDFPMPSSLNTAEWIYVNGAVSAGSNSTLYSCPRAYSLKDQTVHTYTNLASVFGGIVRLSPDKLGIWDSRLTNVPNVVDNALQPTQNNTLPFVAPNQILFQRIDETRFLLLLYADNGRYPRGFYITDDAFQTVTNIPGPAMPALAYTKVLSPQKDAWALLQIDSPHYPMRKMRNGEIWALFDGTTTNITITLADTVDTSAAKLAVSMPVVWKVNADYTLASTEPLMGNTLAAKVAETIKLYYTASNVTVSWNTAVLLESRLLFRMRVSGDKTLGSTEHIFIIDLETGEFKASKPYAQTFLQRVVFADLKLLLYDKYNNTLYTGASKDTEAYAIDLNTAEVTNQIPKMYGEFSYACTSYPRYMPSATTFKRQYKFDKRCQDRGIDAANIWSICILNSDMPDIAFSTPGRPISRTSHGTNGAELRPEVPCPNNLTEYDGDLYWGQPTGLYKIPLKTKRQMPYIKHGYMKVLNDGGKL